MELGRRGWSFGVAGALLLFFAVTGCSRSGSSQVALATPNDPPDKSAADRSPSVRESNPGQSEAPSSPPDAADVPPFRKRIVAPSLEGGVGWFNTAGPVDLKDLKGKWVILDFWTYCCINCMHILPELKQLEHAHPDDLVVIGVHSAKFDAEKDSRNILEAALRYEIEHPIVNDAEHKIWDNYDISAWPSLRIIDPEGFLVAAHSAEFEWELLDKFIKDKTPYYEQKGLLNRQPLKFDQAAAKARQTPLRFPSKILADEQSGRLFISDSNHNRIVIASLDGKLQEVIGSGALGRDDGGFAKATFHHPQGLALHAETLYVADTENHLLRKIDLKAKSVKTIAGVGSQGRSGWPGFDLAAVRRGEDVQMPDRFFAPPRETPLNSPWDLWLHKQDLFIAMAGPHQIWRMPLDESEIGVYAGNGREDVVDGILVPPEPYLRKSGGLKGLLDGESRFSSFAQPSGLTGDDNWLYVADSEGSSIRAVPFESESEEQVKTIVGTAKLDAGRLFQFGDVDGEGERVRLQHCLGVAYHNGLIYIADTYNGKIKVLDPRTASVKTIAGIDRDKGAADPASFNEPSGLAYANGKLYVADTNHHLIKTVDLNNGNRVATLEIAGLQPPNPPAAAQSDDKPIFPRAVEVSVSAVTVNPIEGHIEFAVRLKLPLGFKINTLAPMRYLVEAVAEQGPVDRSAIGQGAKVDPPAEEFTIKLPTTAATGNDKIKIFVGINYCQEGEKGECRIGSVAFVVPLKIADDGEAAIHLEYEAP